MEHIMKLNPNAFKRMQDGLKIREYRLNDEKRQKVRIGDSIKFLCLPDLNESIIMDVIKIETFDNWKECYEKYFDEDFSDRYNNIDDVIQNTYDKFYTKEETDKYGCVVLTLKKHN